MNDERPETILRRWAEAYRDENNAEYRFPSDPHAEFFPQDMDFAAREIDRLTFESRALFDLIKCDALLIERFNAAVERYNRGAITYEQLSTGSNNG